jgi:pimeloyl-ACP methyl ester carboxylesterase
VRFCTASDGVRIAYSTIGHGPPIVRAGNWVTHLELDWGIATRRELVETLAQNRTVVRYDQRGNGLSDWDVDDISFDAFIDDLEAVIDDLGLDRFALFGQSQGAAVAAVYAARHPEKVSHLVMLGGFARGRRKRGLTSQTAESDALITLIREGWGKDNPAYVQMFGSLFMPGANSDQLAVFTDLQKASTTPDNAARIRFAIDDIDVSDEMENVKAPTLVVHAREDAMAPVEEGRRIAAAISGAVFVQLESRNHILLPNEPAWQRFLQKFQSFLST